MDAALRDLEEMAEKLQETAWKLMPGSARDALLGDIGRFLDQIINLRRANGRRS